MAVSSIQDYVQSLVGRRLVEPKVRGVRPIDIEATAVLETVATTLILNPRVVLYLAHLARNGLLKTATEMLAAIDTLVSDIKDLDNQSFAISDTSSLAQARTALLQIDQQKSLNTSGGSFRKFDRAVEDFLQKQLSKNVRKVGTSTMKRPAVEAAQALPTDFVALKGLHSNLIERLYALAVGVRNFSTKEVGSLLGITASYRVRYDIEEILRALASDPTAAESRDYTVRLVAGRAALQMLGSPPNVSLPVVDTAAGLPFGYSLKAYTPATAAATQTTDGPWAFGAGATATLSTQGVVVTKSFPLSDRDLADRAIVVGAFSAFPADIPARTHLFLDVGGTSVFVALNYTEATVSMTLAEVLSAINTALGSLGEAFEFPSVGGNRVAIVANSPASYIAFLGSALAAHPGATSGVPSVFTNSALSQLGFNISDKGTAGANTPAFVADALVGAFSPYLQAQPAGAGVLISTTATGVGADFELAAPAVLGLPESRVYPVATSFRLYGGAVGETPSDVSSVGLVGPGDTAIVNGVTTKVASVVGADIFVEAEVPCFSGDAVVYSALVGLWDSLDAAVKAYLSKWLKSKFASNLDYLDSALAPVYGEATPAQRGDALRAIELLRTLTADLITSLSGPSLPNGASLGEAKIVTGILETLRERKFDRAAAMLLRCRIREVFDLDNQTASYAGELMAALADFAQNNVRFPNRALDESSNVKGLREVL